MPPEKVRVADTTSDPKEMEAKSTVEAASPVADILGANMRRKRITKPSATRRTDALWKELSLLYREYILFRVLGQHAMPPTADGRHIDLDASGAVPLIDERTGSEYISNSIRSSRYTIWTFLPFQLWFQFTKVANLYFLVTGILQLIPGLSTTGTYTTILPLLFFLSFSIAREGYDDFRRHQLDKVENRRLTKVLYGYRIKESKYETRQSLIRLVQVMWNHTLEQGLKVGRKIAETVTACSGVKRMNATTKEQDVSKENPWATVTWVEVKVGDIIQVNRDDQIPADIVLLYADGRNGTAYIETMALDGETNLKSKQPPDLLAKHCKTIDNIANCRAQIVAEDPNLNLYDFNGRVTVHEETVPLTLNNVIYRGTILRNTAQAIGVVINTGEECKIRMNASQNLKAKSPALQTATNRVVIFLAAFWVLLTAGCSAGYLLWTIAYEKQAWYLDGGHLPFEDIVIAFAIEFNNFIPLSLYVSLEMIKFVQFLMLRDIEMYDEESNTPMVSNTQTIYENLGQVTHIFSDKTGTLTENIMRFRRMSVSGLAWDHDLSEVLETHPKTESVAGDSEKACDAGQEGITSAQRLIDSTDNYTSQLLAHMQTNPSDLFTKKAKMFLLSLALCHTCFPEVEQDGKINYQATSPDEVALVQAAKELGYIVTDRSTQSITITTPVVDSDSATPEVYEIIDTIDFSTKRKRMSIIVKFPDGRLCLLCKGADSIMKPKFYVGFLDEKKSRAVSSMELRRLPRNGWDQQEDHISCEINKVLQEDDRDIFNRCEQHIDRFAVEGLRTLLFGYRFLTEKEYSSWRMTYKQATTSLINRQEMIEAAADIIEQDFELAGATAIEDKLQKGVPETIEKLHRANIKIWMLTGDKRETAINIAHSARICKAHSHLIVLHHDDVNLKQNVASAFLNAVDMSHSVIVIDGQLLLRIEGEEELSSLFYELLPRVDSVICCRASPSQKAALVKKIRDMVPGSLTLAIGDGGNDISMIKEAHVGVGISGKEGLQAARVADYSIAQFRFLQRLLLVHGHWNYIRTAKYVLATFWKEMVFYSVQVIYQRWAGYTGTSLYESDSLAVWNTLFTSLCVIVPGIFEQDLSAATLLAVPELYKYGQDSRAFNLKKYFSWMAVAVCEGMMIYFMVYILYGTAHTTRDQTLFAIGDLAFSACAVFINFKLL